MNRPGRKQTLVLHLYQNAYFFKSVCPLKHALFVVPGLSHVIFQHFIQ